MKNCTSCEREISKYGNLCKYKKKSGEAVEKRYALKGLCGMCAKRKLNGMTYKFVRSEKCKRPLHSKWENIQKRCYKTSCKDYKYYGAKGVIVCDEWINRDNGFENFEKWCMANGYSKELTIDRINPKGNYEPSNCRFITPEEQNKNQRPKSNMGEDYIFSLIGKHYATSNFRIYISNRKSKYCQTLEQAKEIRLQFHGY